LRVCNAEAEKYNECLEFEAQKGMRAPAGDMEGRFFVQGPTLKGALADRGQIAG
jgi:hypothetical protein